MEEKFKPNMTEEIRGKFSSPMTLNMILKVKNYRSTDNLFDYHIWVYLLKI